MRPGAFAAPFRISIHALREESDYMQNRKVARVHQISIHALREESDRRGGCH